MSDRMLRVKEVIELTGFSQGKAYNIIKKLKQKHKCKYKEAFISERLFREEYKLENRV